MKYTFKLKKTVSALCATAIVVSIMSAAMPTYALENGNIILSPPQHEQENEPSNSAPLTVEESLIPPLQDNSTPVLVLPVEEDVAQPMPSPTLEDNAGEEQEAASSEVPPQNEIRLLDISQSANTELALLAVSAAPSLESRSAGTVITGESGVNLANNAGLENGGAADFEAWGKNDAVLVNTDTAFTHSGAKSARVAQGTASAFAFSGINADYNRTQGVKAGMWVYLSDATDADKVLIVLERKVANDTGAFNIMARPAAQAGWQKVIFNGALMNVACNEHVIKYEVQSTLSGDVYFDDAFVYTDMPDSINIIRNSGFDTNADSWSGGAGGVTTAQAHSGAGSFKLEPDKDLFQASGWWPNKQSVNTGGSLYFSAWIKSEGFTGEVFLRAEQKSDADRSFESTHLTNGVGWRFVCVEMPAQAAYINEALFHIQTSAGAGDVYIDDVKVSPIAPEAGAVPSIENRAPGVVITGGIGVNLVSNAGLEHDNQTDFNDWGKNGVVINQDTTFTHSGAKSVKVVAGAAETAFAYSSLSAEYNRNEALSAGIWVYLSNKEDADKVQLVIERKSADGDKNITARPASQIGWQKLVLTGAKADTDITEHVIKFEVASGNIGDIYFDDAFIYSAKPDTINLVRNGGFEINADAWSGGAGSISTAKAHSGGASFKLEPDKDFFQASGWWPNKQSVNTGEKLYFGAWVYSEDFTGEIFVRAEQKSDIDRYYESAHITKGDGWRFLCVEIPSQAAYINEILFHIQATAGTGTIYIDDVIITPVEPINEDLPESTESRIEGTIVTGQTAVNSLKNAGFEESLAEWGAIGATLNTNTKRTHSGAKSLGISANTEAHIWNVLPGKLNFNATSEVSTWIFLTKAEDADKINVKYQRKNNSSAKGEVLIDETILPLSFVAGWQMVKATAPALLNAEANMSIFLIDIDMTHQGAVYIDDSFVATPDAPPVVLTQYATNPGFELVDNGAAVANWGLMPGWETVQNAISKDIVHQGETAVRVPQGNVERALVQSSNWINPDNTARYDASKPMLFTMWLKYENITGDGIFLKAERKYGEQAALSTSAPLTGTSNGWQKVELYIPPEARSFDEIIVGLIVSSGTGTVWADDVDFAVTPFKEPTPETRKGAVIELPLTNDGQAGMNWLTNPSFEQKLVDWGVVGSGVVQREDAKHKQNALKIMSDAHVWNTVIMDRNSERNAALTLSFYVNITNELDAQWLEFYAERKDEKDTRNTRYTFHAKAVKGWQRVAVNIPYESEMPTRNLVVGVDCIAKVDPVYLDNFYLTFTNGNPPESFTNYLANPDFTFGDGTADKWGTIPDWRTAVKLVEDGYNSPRAVLMELEKDKEVNVFQANAWGGAQQYDKTKPMLLQAWVKADKVTGDGLLMKLERKNQEVLVGDAFISERLTGTTKGWQRIELYLPPTTDIIDDLIIGFQTAPGNGKVWLSNLSLRECKARPYTAKAQTSVEPKDSTSETLKNPGVEQLNPDGTVTHWDVWPGNPAEGTRKSYTSTDIKHSGERSVCIELVFSNPQAIYQYRLPDDNPFPFNEDYTFSAWVKADNVAVYDGKGVKIGIKRKGIDGKEYNQFENVELGTFDWTKIEITVPKAEVDIVQYDVIFDIGSGSGKIYFDDFELTKGEALTKPESELEFKEVKPEQEKPEKTQTQPEEQAKKSSFPLIPLAIGSTLIVGAGIAAWIITRKKAVK